MTLALAVIAVLATTPAVRGRIALGPTPAAAARVATAVTVAGAGVLAVLLGALAPSALDISGATIRIAAGLVVAVTSLPDLWRRLLVAERSSPAWRAGVVPVAWPEVFGPPLAFVLASAAIDRGMVVGLLLAATAAFAVTVVDRLPGPRRPSRAMRAAATARAAIAVAVGIALIMNGVYDI